MPRPRQGVLHPVNRMLADNVRRLRAAHGWTQEDLAFASGVHTRLVQSVENGTADTRVSTIGRLADGLEVDARELFKRPRAGGASKVRRSPKR